jgi:(1->4)-alpha-D-glucan 1-alpha-D-glucosylmutase
MAERGTLAVADTPEGPVLRAEEMEVPLAPGPLSEAERAGEPEAIRALHGRQAWRLAHWELERDGVTHRRFFNVTGLIGMRVEDERVFDDTHALVLDLIREGSVDALRVDHVDGLADPGAYLARLRDAAGVPVWVEKILMEDETLSPWPVEGTTGYEAGAAIARVLTDAGGLQRLDALWRAETGEARDWPAILREAKGQVLRQDLAAELGALRRLAGAALEADGTAEIEAGEEALREAVIALLVEMPRYRTYLETGRPAELALLDAAAGRAAAALPAAGALRWLAGAIGDGDTAEARRLRVRFQQVSGALMAKAQEDTAFFRHVRCLAHCEVGGGPGDAAWTPRRFGDWLAGRSGRDLSLTSSHDTKRAEDARARLLAMTHLPEAFAEVLGASKGVPYAVPPAHRWYVVQSLLAIWEEGREDIPDRLALHVEKALREAREVTTWAHPREAAEARTEDFARALAAEWALALPAGARELMALGDELSLAQVALKMVMPGVPDLYQGAEGPLHHLTDPDNRLPVAWDARLGAADGLGARKGALTRRLLRLRSERPAFFATAATRVEEDGASWRLVREGPEGRLALSLGAGPPGLDWTPA